MREPEKSLDSLLEEYRRKPAPPGLKERVLRSVEEQKRLRTAATPVMRKLAAVCLALTALCLGAELMMTRSETRLLDALLGPDGSSAERQVREDIHPEQAEFLGLGKHEESILSLRLNRQKSSTRARRIDGLRKINIISEGFNGS
jgi:hypothetical protein